ncbi:amino acid permease/ SLC12A domain-containing protein [Ilyonectria destructans]|nr:amino acid permease/ SLC12A domain-containing protein [Ilyonectria destructans]
MTSGKSVLDVEDNPDVNVGEVVDQYGTVHRGLKSRHIQFTALGGTIGTGLFLGIGTALTRAGPLSLLLGYFLTGLCLYAMMTGLGEMATWLPLPGAIPQFCSRYVDEALGFAIGYTNWYAATFSACSDLSAAAIVIQYWNTEISAGVWIAIILAVILLLNCIAVGIYGEAEFVLVTIKVLTLLGLLILSLVIDLGGGPTHERLGFMYWKNPGAMNVYLATGSFGRFLGFFSTLINASFSYGGIELVAVAAGEAQNPRRNIPKAVRRTFWRILFFYILGSLAIGCIVPYNDNNLLSAQASGAPGAARSPWVIGIQKAGISGLPSIINAVILSSAISAANEWLFAGSRYLYALAQDGKTPKVFAYCSKAGIPWVCVFFTAAVLCLTFLNVSNAGSTVFNWFSSITAIANCFTWGSVSISYLQFHKALKAQNISRDSLPYKAPLQPYATYVALAFFAMVILFSGFPVFVDGFNVQGFVTSYINIPFFLTLSFGYKLIKKTKIRNPIEVDLHSGKAEIDMLEGLWEEEHPKHIFGKIWNWIA